MTSKRLAKSWRIQSIEIQWVADVVKWHTCARYMFAVVQAGPRAYATVWSFN